MSHSFTPLDTSNPCDTTRLDRRSRRCFHVRDKPRLLDGRGRSSHNTPRESATPLIEAFMLPSPWLFGLTLLSLGWRALKSITSVQQCSFFTKVLPPSPEALFRHVRKPTLDSDVCPRNL
mmetsp:Transcript_3010/g.7236  ORF Transcript_3010/g.7236 Transcript_3010/m.7236 type:complete len:120 (+) Transcript_3010:112-471(+)